MAGYDRDSFRADRRAFTAGMLTTVASMVAVEALGIGDGESTPQPQSGRDIRREGFDAGYQMGTDVATYNARTHAASAVVEMMTLATTLNYDPSRKLPVTVYMGTLTTPCVVRGGLVEVKYPLFFGHFDEATGPEWFASQINLPYGNLMLVPHPVTDLVARVREPGYTGDPYQHADVFIDPYRPSPSGGNEIMWALDSNSDPFIVPQPGIARPVS